MALDEIPVVSRGANDELFMEGQRKQLGESYFSLKIRPIRLELIEAVRTLILHHLS